MFPPNLHPVGHQIKYMLTNTGNHRGQASNPTHTPPTQDDFNINKVFQELVTNGSIAASKSVPRPASSLIAPVRSQGTNEDLSKPPRKISVESLSHVTFHEPKTLKVRQNLLYDLLHSGKQCGSCGMRFLLEQSAQYTQHLDWHFRQNRRRKKNARVAARRGWYYSLSDWKKYEELEDVEERGTYLYLYFCH